MSPGGQNLMSFDTSEPCSRSSRSQRFTDADPTLNILATSSRVPRPASWAATARVRTSMGIGPGISILRNSGDTRSHSRSPIKWVVGRNQAQEVNGRRIRPALRREVRAQLWDVAPGEPFGPTHPAVFAAGEEVGVFRHPQDGDPPGLAERLRAGRSGSRGRTASTWPRKP